MGLWLEPPEGASAPATDVLERAAGAVAAAERAGIGSVWVSSSPRPVGPDTPYEAYSLLGALAVRSERVHLGAVADAAERRAPSILAKIVTGIDVLSHGRGVLALDGDGTSDHDGQRLTEALTVCRSVLEDEHPTFSGRIYSIQDAVNRPAPVQTGGVPVVVHLWGDGPGRDALLEVAARLADAVVVDGGADGVLDACRVVEARGGGRRPVGRCAVLGRIGAGSGTDEPATATATATVAAVAGIRSAGAAGCLVGLPFPWVPGAVAGLASLW
jgi:alkanesulfonate monooxygenase SsuD/methylene tetrahydromethanopterin reductase-like flavin-dependent oxidoreductase (luciferase family)